MSIAKGEKLNEQTFADFVNRLQYHCRGEGVNEHCTAQALFVVQTKKYIIGIDADYCEDIVLVHCDGCQWFKPSDWWSELDEDQRAEYAGDSAEEFLELPEHQQWDLLRELGSDYTVTGYKEAWEFVTAHFTREGAEAYIERKGHDHDELRIFVDAQSYCWEFNTIKEALMDGRLVLADPKP